MTYQEFKDKHIQAHLDRGYRTHIWQPDFFEEQVFIHYNSIVKEIEEKSFEAVKRQFFTSRKKFQKLLDFARIANSIHDDIYASRHSELNQEIEKQKQELAEEKLMIEKRYKLSHNIVMGLAQYISEQTQEEETKIKADLIIKEMEKLNDR